MNLEVLGNPDVHRAAKLNADVRNLENAIRRNLQMLLDGYLVVLPGRTITTPHPELIDDDLINQLNERMTACAVECSEILVKAQTDALKKLRDERDELGTRFHPTALEMEEMTKIRDQRTYEQRTYTRQPRGQGPLSFFTAPDPNKGQRFIGVNHKVSSYLSTGRRYSGNQNGNQTDRDTGSKNSYGGNNRNYRGSQGNNRRQPPRQQRNWND